MHSASTHTPCSIIVKFHFFANLVISYGIERRKDPAGVGRNSMCQNSCGQSPCAVSLTSMSVHSSPLPVFQPSWSLWNGGSVYWCSD